jgi:hypothetical protein
MSLPEEDDNQHVDSLMRLSSGQLHFEKGDFLLSDDLCITISQNRETWALQLSFYQRCTDKHRRLHEISL